MTSLHELNLMDQAGFVTVCGPIFEHSPWIAELAWLGRPYASISQLHQSMCLIVEVAPAEEKLKLICAHPDLVGQLAREGKLTRQSTGEQASAGLTRLTPEEALQFDQYNAAYRERFGFPFVICARENKKEAILAAFPRRLQNDRVAEIFTALAEIYNIARLRLSDTLCENR